MYNDFLGALNTFFSAQLVFLNRASAVISSKKRRFRYALEEYMYQIPGLYHFQFSHKHTHTHPDIGTNIKNSLTAASRVFENFV